MATRQYRFRVNKNNYNNYYDNPVSNLENFEDLKDSEIDLNNQIALAVKQELQLLGLAKESEKRVSIGYVAAGFLLIFGGTLIIGSVLGYYQVDKTFAGFINEATTPKIASSESNSVPVSKIEIAKATTPKIASSDNLNEVAKNIPMPGTPIPVQTELQPNLNQSNVQLPAENTNALNSDNSNNIYPQSCNGKPPESRNFNLQNPDDRKAMQCIIDFIAQKQEENNMMNQSYPSPNLIPQR